MSSVPEAPEVGTGSLLSGRYELGRLIGEGGMGRVFAATHPELGRRVAVKVLSPILAKEPLYLERFRREAIAAASLDTPHTIVIHDFHPGDDADPPYLVMEHLEGRSLLERLQEGRVPPAEAPGIILPLLEGLEEAHAADIVHRDLKPSNVFLARDDDGAVVVKLLDFGVAKLKESKGFSRLTAQGDMVGTPRYAAPEQLRGQPVDGRSDVYAAGVLLYGMLAGRPPFLAAGQGDLIREILEEEPVPLRTFAPDVSDDLARVVATAMAKDPDRRFASAAAFARALRHVTWTHADDAEPSAAGERTGPLSASPIRAFLVERAQRGHGDADPTEAAPADVAQRGGGADRPPAGAPSVPGAGPEPVKRSDRGGRARSARSRGDASRAPTGAAGSSRPPARGRSGSASAAREPGRAGAPRRRGGQRAVPTGWWMLAAVVAVTVLVGGLGAAAVAALLFLGTGR
ncbi:MAG: protein kinase [Sandaracinaceae bacterium]